MNNQTGYVANSNSFFINDKLRNNLDLIDEFKETVNALDELISTNVIDENILLFRNDGIGFIESHFKTSISGMDTKTAIEHLNKVKPENISSGAYTSTSTIKDVNVFKSRKIHSEIRVKKGTNAYVANNFTESEIILGRNQKFKVLEIKEEGDKIKIILEVD